MKKLYLIVSICFVFNNLLAQETCSNKLKTAERYFDEGLLDEIPNMLNPCIKNGFNKAERRDALKLLIQTYLYSDEFDLADKTMLRFLKDFPEYELATSDSREFGNLHKTYETNPIFQLEANGGVSFAFVRVREYFGIEDQNSIKASYSSRPGLFFKSTYSTKLKESFNVNGGISLSQLNFFYSNQAFDFTTTTGLYTSTYVGLPLSVHYEYGISNFVAYLRVGIEPSVLLSAKYQFTRTFTTGQEEITGQSDDMMPFRKRIDLKPMFEVGVKYKLGKAYLGLNAGIKLGSIGIVDEDKRYSDLNIVNKYFYVDDDIILHQAYVSFAYIFSFYKPKKIETP